MILQGPSLWSPVITPSFQWSLPGSEKWPTLCRCHVLLSLNSRWRWCRLCVLAAGCGAVAVFLGVHVPFSDGFLGIYVGPRVGMQTVDLVPLHSFFSPLGTVHYTGCGHREHRGFFSLQAPPPVLSAGW